ncbi:hypothetical protein IWT25_00766 [Secundilactobacillus pentosiphilus]|uniref:Phage tail protein n=1 Tax=Secundilactobacillus pentosiphilus TaxID=1714682 RepID=A0A1Z5IUL6_9LACO|nr:hypothetical protein [Secundilactobacillus pentosiphilus]GAX05460.1 hypothetical protein IWT25_00766 [Secundilactobacillus pentosiphilus]
MSKVKLFYDVNFQTLIKQASASSKAANFLIALPGDAESLTSYGSLDEVAEKYDESTATYKLAAEFFNTLAKDSVYDEPLAVGIYVDQDQPDPMGVVNDAPVVNSITTTDTTATVDLSAATVPNVNGLVHMLTNYFKAGWRFVTAPEATTEQLEATMDFLYENQDGILLTQVSTTDDADALKQYATKFVDENKMLPVIVLADKEDQPNIGGAAAEATGTVPLNWRHIGNLPDITPNDWTMPEVQQFDNDNAIPVVNKAGDFMFLHGRALDGHYIDNVFGIQYVYDFMQSGLQKWLDLPAQRFFKFNDAGLSLLKAQAQSLLDQLGTMGFFAEGDDGKPLASVTVPTRAQVSTASIEARRTRMQVNVTLANLIDTIDGQINFTI